MHEELVSPTNRATARPTAPLSDVDNELISGIVEAAPDGIIMIDGDGVIVLVNRQTEELFGYDRGELLGKLVEELLPERLQQAHGVHRTRYQADPRTRPMGAGMALLARRANGTEFAVEISLSPLVAGGENRTIAMVRDTTERIEAEQFLRQVEENVQLLEERERIARDLHDLVIQRLFAAGMALQTTVSRANDRDVAARVARVVDDLDDTIRQLRSVIFGLHERRTSARSLRAEALRVIADERAALGFNPQLRFDGAIDTLGNAVADQLLPTLREALSNVARHAAATSAEVELRATTKSVMLRVADNGVGGAGDAPPGNGLRNARDRATSLQGECSIRTGPEGGTVFEWCVPTVP
jgi:two-component system, NarL family, sensor histidine kinase DevS